MKIIKQDVKGVVIDSTKIGTAKVTPYSDAIRVDLEMDLFPILVPNTHIEFEDDYKYKFKRDKFLVWSMENDREVKIGFAFMTAKKGKIFTELYLERFPFSKLVRLVFRRIYE